MALEIGVGACYFVLAHFSFVHFLHQARARGTLDFH